MGMPQSEHAVAPPGGRYASAIRRPTVRSVSTAELHELCLALAEQVCDFDPDVVVGIATGGAEVAEEITRVLGGSARLVIVKSQRPGTRVKQGRLVSVLLAGLPQRAADVLRWAEVEHRELLYYRKLRRHGTDRTEAQTRIVRPDVLANAARGAERVLVVDDTLDSGQTLSGVVAATRAASPTAEVRTAVIATTWRRPPIMPDHYLHDRLLLRLPSSFDA